MTISLSADELGLDAEPVIRSIATIRMFVAAHNVVLPGDRITGEELELLDDTANELEGFLMAYKRLLRGEERRIT